MPIRLSGKEIVSALGKDGWLVARVSGSQCAGSWQQTSAGRDTWLHLQIRRTHG